MVPDPLLDPPDELPPPAVLAVPDEPPLEVVSSLPPPPVVVLVVVVEVDDPVLLTAAVLVVAASSPSLSEQPAAASASAAAATTMPTDLIVALTELASAPLGGGSPERADPIPLSGAAVAVPPTLCGRCGSFRADPGRNSMDVQQQRIAALETSVAALLARVEAQERELEMLRPAAGVAAPAPTEPRDPRRPDAGERLGAAVDRRTAIRRTAAVAAAAAGGAAVLAQATPAAAGNGDFLEVGATVVQDVAAATRLAYEPAGAGGLFNAFDVRAGEIADTTDFPAMVAGRAGASKPPLHGVYGGTVHPESAGVVADSAGWGVLARGVRAALLLAASASPIGDTNYHEAGELLVDEGYTYWACIEHGVPGEFRRLGGAGTVGALTLWDSPRRVYDSRPGQAPLGVQKGALDPGVNRTIDLTVDGGVPEGAIAALCNVTVAETSPAGWLKVFKAGGTIPSGTNLNWFQPGSVVANATTVALDDTQSCSLRTGSGPAQVIVDVVGYYL